MPKKRKWSGVWLVTWLFFSVSPLQLAIQFLFIFVHGFADVGIGVPSKHEAEESAGESAEKGCAFAEREEGSERCLDWVGVSAVNGGRVVGKKLAKAIEGDRTDANEDEDEEVDTWYRAKTADEAVEQAGDEDKAIDGDITFAERHFITHLLITTESAGG